MDRVVGHRMLASVVIGLLLVLGGNAAFAQEPEEPQPDLPYPSVEWAAREAANFARVGEAPVEQAVDPDFLQRLELQSLVNLQEFVERQLADPDWRTTGNLCETLGEQCAGDPYRYPGVDDFYDTAIVEPVAFLDRGGARLSGRVWAPATGSSLPAVVITNGSVQAPETLYWWAAQALVQSGYVVMTFDPRGQGRSDNSTPTGEQGSNANANVFVSNTIDAVDFLRSTPDRPYIPNEGDARATTAFNPLWERIDRDRLGLAGHSLGAGGVSVVQGIEPWPGDEGDPDGGNPVDVIVAWDNLNGPGNALAGFDVEPRVPAMGVSADYFLTPTPYTAPPDVDGKRQGFLAWAEAEVPTYQLVIEGGSHYEFSLIPTFPTSSWEAGGAGGWGRPLVEFYTLAWFDRYLKTDGESGFADADARLLAEDTGGTVDASWRQRLSFYFHSSRDYIDRVGAAQVCEDIRIGCEVPAPAPPPSAPASDAPAPAPSASPVPAPAAPAPALPTTGGGMALAGLLLAAAAGRRRR